MVCWEVVVVQVQVEVLSLWRPFPSLVPRARPTPNFTAQPRASNSLWLLSLSQAELSCRGHTTKCSVQGDRTAANLHSIATTPWTCCPASRHLTKYSPTSHTPSQRTTISPHTTIEGHPYITPCVLSCEAYHNHSPLVLQHQDARSLGCAPTSLAIQTYDSNLHDKCLCAPSSKSNDSADSTT